MIKRTESWILLISITLIIILGFAIYFNSFKGEFVWDDKGLVKDNIFIKSWHKLPHIFANDITVGGSNFYRPLQMLTYMVDYHIWGLNVIGYHLTNTLLHILVALAVFWLIYILFANWRLSFLASMIFVIHPLHTETVAYISGRAESLSALFILLSIIFYIKQISSRKVVIYILMLACYIAALLSKEYSLIFPLLLILYSYVFNKKFLTREFLSVVIITLIYSVLRFTVLKFTSPTTVYIPTLLQRIPGFLVAITEYFRLLLLPLNLHMEYGSKFFRFSHPKAILGTAILFALLIYAFRKRKTNRLIFFSVNWFFLALLPHSNLYPINAYMAEHWIYLPSMGVILILANGLILLYSIRRMRLIATTLIMCILFFYSYLTQRQNFYWKEPIAFYKRTLKYAPNSAKIYGELGKEYAGEGRIEDAITVYKKSIELNSNSAVVYNNLAALYTELGNYEEAIALYKKAIQINPLLAQAYNNLGTTYFRIGKYDEAIVSYKKAIEINSNFEQPCYNLGSVYNNLGVKEKAIALLKKTIEINPRYLPAYSELIFLYEIIGEEEIIPLYKKVIANNLDYFDAYYNIGNLYSDMGKYRQAIALYKKAIIINPGSVETYVALGNLYCAIGKNKEAIAFLKKALELNSNLGVIHNNLSVAYYYKREYELAVKHCDRAIELGYRVNPALLGFLKAQRK